MRTITSHQLLLHMLCDLMPEAEARRFADLDPDDLSTMVEAYLALRTSVAIPLELRRALVATICTMTESRAADSEGPTSGARASNVLHFPVQRRTGGR